MQVQLKDNVSTATQWFKDGDHPAVVQHQYLSNSPIWYGIKTFADELRQSGSQAPDIDEETRIIPGMWIVEMFDGIHLYNDEEFKRLFCEVKETMITGTITLI